MINCINAFSGVSGLTLNMKMCPVPVGEACVLTEGFPVKEQMTYLGTNICRDQSERVISNFQHLNPKMKNRFDLWLMRDIHTQCILQK